MAKKSVLELFVPFDQLGLSGSILMTEQSKKKIVYTDFENGGEVVLEGTGFHVIGGKVTAGTVDEISIFNGQGKALLEFSGIDINVKPLPQPVPMALLGAVLDLGLGQPNLVLGSKKSDVIESAGGNDIIKGRGGADALDGGLGKDLLYGGAGADQFNFAAGYGKDRVMDFDADGSDGSQDLIHAVFADILSKKTIDGNAVLDFGDGDTLTLVGVKAKDIDETDFVV